MVGFLAQETACGGKSGVASRRLFPRVGFIITNMSTGEEGVVRFYNGRGIAEQWIKEGNIGILFAQKMVNMD